MKKEKKENQTIPVEENGISYTSSKYLLKFNRFTLKKS